MIPENQAVKRFLQLRIVFSLIKTEIGIWLALVICIVIPLLLGKSSNNIIVLLNNICYGYIAGFVFYYISAFRIKVSNREKALFHIISVNNHIVFSLWRLWLRIGVCETNGERFKEKYQEYGKSAIISSYGTYDENSLQEVLLKRDMIKHINAWLHPLVDTAKNTLSEYGSYLNKKELSVLQSTQTVVSELFYSYYGGGKWRTTLVDVTFFLDRLFSLYVATSDELARLCVFTYKDFDIKILSFILTSKMVKGE